MKMAFHFLWLKRNIVEPILLLVSKMHYFHLLTFLDANTQPYFRRPA